ncbi:DUF6183 family protein [Sphaerisporangium sp. NPDC049002]|uniref:DUF6183 family protein n=1 Tax=unclassified Sphaerisporangium TaxID=2630420 RepID=UPI0033CDBBDC
MTSHEITSGLHDPALSRVPGDPGALAELVRGQYGGDQYGVDRQRGQIRDLAALLAERRQVHHLLPLLEHVPAEPDAWAELIACLTQELVVRRVNLTRVPAAARCAAALRELGHPLADLPLKRTRAERWMNRTCLDPGSAPYRGLPAPEHPEITRLLPGPADPEGPAARGDGERPTPLWDAWAESGGSAGRVVSTREDERNITAALEHWSSPGEEARIIELPRCFDLQELLPLGVNTFLSGTFRAHTALTGVRVSLDGVVDELFTKAYCDASWNRGLRAGYGRLRAWQSVAGLVRAAAGSSVHRVNELAARWRWMAFGTTRRQPYWVYQGLAIGALSPRGNVLSLLISHDTD